MTRIMGIDTGGTYTDGVIVDPEAKKILCKTKVFTQKHDLMSSIHQCIENLMACETEKVSMVCLSTTLATNAIVEGRRAKAGLVLIGGKPEGPLPADLCIPLRGKLDIKGREIERMEQEDVINAIETLKDHVDAVAVSGYASVRNPSHELLVKKMIRERCFLPVVCAHELTSQLGYYERTVTAAWNAGLIPIIRELIHAVKNVLKSKGMDLPIMIVKGDGSLMQESFAIDRPIETILSGPAASVMGAVYLTNQKNAVILDMGGTTTDIARVSDGRVRIRKRGANVGGWFPQIQAADILTFGIGGDSGINISSDGEWSIGPRRVQPLCVAGRQYPRLIHELEAIRTGEDYSPESKETDCFALINMPDTGKLNKLDRQVLRILQGGAHSLFVIAKRLGVNPEELDMEKLVNLDAVQRIAMTPTDLLHASGTFLRWEEKISWIGSEILAGKMKKTVPDFLKTMECYITNQLCDACRKSIAGFQEEYAESPLIAIGAPVKAWMPAVSEMLQTSLIIPEHAEVANAIGAAAGQIIETVEALIRPEKDHPGFILHAPWECRNFSTLKEAGDYAVAAGRHHASELAKSAGSDSVEVTEIKEDLYVDDFNGNSKIYIETKITITAIGRPKWRPF